MYDATNMFIANVQNVFYMIELKMSIFQQCMYDINVVSNGHFLSLNLSSSKRSTIHHTQLEQEPL